jgi:hypothetical protein
VEASDSSHSSNEKAQAEKSSYGLVLWSLVNIVKEETLPFIARKGLKSANPIDNSIHIMTVNAACEVICKYTLKPTVSQMKEVPSKIVEVFPHTKERLGSRHDA